MNEQEWLTSNDPARMLAVLTTKRTGRLVETPFDLNISDRKLRLFACACARQAWALLTDDALCGRCRGGLDLGVFDAPDGRCPDCAGTGRINRSRRAVLVAESYADGEATEEELRAAQEAAFEASSHWPGSPESAAHDVSCAYPHDGDYGCVAPTLQAALLRDVVGNPFRPVALPLEDVPCPVCHKHPGLDARIPDAGRCKTCGGSARVKRCPWLTPTVVSLAQAAYLERLPPAACGRCGGGPESERRLLGWEPRAGLVREAG